MSSSLESPTFRWKHDKWITTPPPKIIEKRTAAQTLDDAHQVAFNRAITNVLATDLAELTFAQLVDGLPLWGVVSYHLNHRHTEGEPVFKHTELCPGAIEKTRALRRAFDPLTMEIRAQALNNYQSAPVGSRASKLPLVELVAVALHELAVQVFKQVDGGFHKNEEYPDDKYYAERPYSRKRTPTPFILYLTFDDPEQYPDGVADVAAYWAEERIFGGVILFGRGKSGKDQDGIWFHSNRHGVTEHVYALREDQTAALTRFLESDPDKASLSCPLPVLSNRENVRRDWRLSMPKYKVYRDPWERKMMYSRYDEYRYESRDCRHFDIDPIERPEDACWMDSGSD